jgi:hypothetical protein
MLDVKERRTRLEKLLGHVQKNRTRLTEKRLTPGQAELETPEEQGVPTAGQGTLQETVSMRKPEKPQPVAAKPKAVAKKPAVKPKAVAKEPPPREEVRQFETTPTSSASVAVTTGQAEREWTLSAVLERAWKLGSPE